ncbi:MAG: xanthine dehydrogenase family protein molybdopterin-binding subunit [Chloroflexota bacterium]
MQTTRAIGQPIKRLEDDAFLRGDGRYVDDLSEPGLLYAHFVRSPHAHARIVDIDLAAARSSPGVAAVLTAAELVGRAEMPEPMRATPDTRGEKAPLLAVDRVRYVGEAVAVVLGESRAAAEDAAALIDVDYEPLRGYGSARAALAPGAVMLHESAPGNICYQRRATQGDTDGAFARAAHVVRVRSAHHRIAAVSLETRAILARPEAGGGLTVWASTQAQHRLRGSLAAALGMAEGEIRVIAPDVGGGFGAKGTFQREDVIVCAAARMLGRPVKWMAGRMEDLLTMQHARDQVDEAEAAFDGKGRCLALRVRSVANVGAYLHGGNTGLFTRILIYPTGAYDIPVLDADVTVAFSNTNPTGAYRGAGRPEATMVIERVMDAAARQIGLDPAEIRRRNFIQPHQFPYRNAGGSTYDSGDYPALLAKALAAADYTGLRREQAARRANGELVGVGLATFIELTGAGWESGRVRFESDGTVTAIPGSTNHGQGHRTSFAQIVADALELPFERVRVRQNDTALTPAGFGTFGSRSTVVGGGALVAASATLRQRACALAAAELEVATTDVEWAGGEARLKGAPERALGVAELAGAATRRGVANDVAGGERGVLEAYEQFDAGGEVISSGAYVAMVSVDRETGRVLVERFTAVDDCGTVINPLLVEGQVHGALAQGFGEALWERMVYDEDGGVLTGSLLDYPVPSAPTLPQWDLDHIVTPSPIQPLGAKGAGEAGTIGAPPTIVSAVHDALGVPDLELPLSDERVWRAATG